MYTRIIVFNSKSSSYGYKPYVFFIIRSTYFIYLHIIFIHSKMLTISLLKIIQVVFPDVFEAFI